MYEKIKGSYSKFTIFLDRTPNVYFNQSKNIDLICLILVILLKIVLVLGSKLVTFHPRHFSRIVGKEPNLLF